MSLSKGKKSDAFFDALRQEEQSAGVALPAAGAPSPGSASAVGAAAAAEETAKRSVRVAVEEQVNISLERDGALRKMEVKGEMKLSVADPDMARLVVVCHAPEKQPGVQFRPHPKIDAKAWTSDAQLVLKDRTKPFPVGSDNATGMQCNILMPSFFWSGFLELIHVCLSSAPGILKWRMAVADEEFVPITVNFWPSSENGRSVVSVEYSVRDDFLGRTDQPFVLQNLSFSLPCPCV